MRDLHQGNNYCIPFQGLLMLQSLTLHSLFILSWVEISATSDFLFPSLSSIKRESLMETPFERERDYQRGVSSSKEWREWREWKDCLCWYSSKESLPQGSLSSINNTPSLSQVTTDLWCATVIYGVELYQTSALWWMRLCSFVQSVNPLGLMNGFPCTVIWLMMVMTCEREGLYTPIIMVDKVEIFVLPFDVDYSSLVWTWFPWLWVISSHRKK